MCHSMSRGSSGSQLARRCHEQQAQAGTPTRSLAKCGPCCRGRDVAGASSGLGWDWVGGGTRAGECTLAAPSMSAWLAGKFAMRL
jgi:hypothetical protein